MVNNLSSKNIREVAIEVIGMHCVSCELWIENSLLKIAGVEIVKSKFSKNILNLSYDSNIISEHELKSQVQEIISSKGYKIKVSENETSGKITSWINLLLSLLIAVLFAIIYISFIGEISIDTNATGTGFIAFVLIGIIASISNCGITVASLFMGWITNKEKTSLVTNTDLLKYLTVFNVFRTVFFLIFGGILGYFGSFFVVNENMYFMLELVSAIIIFSLALNLLEIFPLFQKYIPRLPSSAISRIFNLQNKGGYFSLILIALFSFFLPCGFTLVVQTQALQSGTFYNGAIIMVAFALGTIPLIAILGYFSNAIANSKFSEIFFKIVGFLMFFYAISILLELFI